MNKEKSLNNIGISVLNPPKKVCQDVNCPFHGRIKIHGRIMEGIVVSMKSRRTARIEWEEVIRVRKYERAYKIKRNMLVHKPDCIDVSIGDVVRVGETRPISKLKTFVIFDVIKRNE
ncbi:MAG: 30S ribosomal protein S17 [Candidatus Woesearchaeota archaeon]